MTLQKPPVRAVVLGIALLMGGCSTFSPSPTEPAAAPPPSAAPAPQQPPAPQPPRPPQPATTSAWKPLVQKARQARDRGDYEQALVLLERAQRIDPESAEIYLQLAQTHRARGDASQARATAERGMLFCVSASQCDALRALTR